MSNNWPELYMYWGEVVTDLTELITEYITECEHQGDEPSRQGNTSVTREERKKLLKKDFIMYFTE